MFCENCGANVSAGSEFCASCGTQVAVTGVSASPSTSSQPIAAVPGMASASSPDSETPTANRNTREYQVIPFNADIRAGQSSGAAAEQLQALINHQSSRGYRYLRMETLRTRITTPANAGCFGIGSTPEMVSYADIYAVVFAKE